MSERNYRVKVVAKGELTVTLRAESEDDAMDWAVEKAYDYDIFECTAEVLGVEG